jgi:hypothetical protein
MRTPGSTSRLTSSGICASWKRRILAAARSSAAFTYAVEAFRHLQERCVAARAHVAQDRRDRVG